jgi:cold shock protein
VRRYAHLSVILDVQLRFRTRTDSPGMGCDRPGRLECLDAGKNARDRESEPSSANRGTRRPRLSHASPQGCAEDRGSKEIRRCFALLRKIVYAEAANVVFDGFGTITVPFVPSKLAKPGCIALDTYPTNIGPKDTHMITGTVKFFNADKGYGFIAPEGGGGDAFVHISAVERAGMRTLDKDQRVSYELETDQRGKTSAVNLQAA